MARWDELTCNTICSNLVRQPNYTSRKWQNAPNVLTSDGSDLLSLTGIQRVKSLPLPHQNATQHQKRKQTLTCPLLNPSLPGTWSSLTYTSTRASLPHTCELCNGGRAKSKDTRTQLQKPHFYTFTLNPLCFSSLSSIYSECCSQMLSSEISLCFCLIHWNKCNNEAEGLLWSRPPYSYSTFQSL